MAHTIIKLPHNLDFEDALAFMSPISLRPGYDLVFDFSQVKWVEPFGMLLVASRIRRIVDACGRNGVSCYVKGHNRTQQSHDYLAHMGFFQSTGINFGKVPGQAPGSQRYVPITELTRDSLVQDPAARFDMHIGETIERRASNLARVLAQSESNLRETLKYSIREIIRNGFEHSESDNIWVAAQCWPNSDKVEIAILDDGIGIKESLSHNPNLSIVADDVALSWAIKPGISGKTHQVSLRRTRSQESEWDNSGYGLYITNALCRLAGDFVIVSGKKALHTTPASTVFHSAHHRGTAVRIQFTISKLPQLQQALKRIVDEGERLAANSGIETIKSASKSSRTATVTDEEIPF